MINRISKAAAVLAGVTLLGLPASGTAAGIKTARFTVQVTGVQTTKWSWDGPSYTDCNGTQTTHGEGTEVFRFDSGKPERLLVRRNMFGAVSFMTGTWDPYSLVDPLGFLSKARLTRHGFIETTTSGGWCGHPPTTNTGPYDCGQRHNTVMSVYVNPVGDGRRIQVEAANPASWKGFKNCPIYTPAGVTAFGFTKTYGRLSNKLLFGKQKKIVVEDGKVYPRNDGGVDALSTTHIRIVLVRH